MAKNYCKEHFKNIFSVAMSTFLVSLVFTTDTCSKKRKMLSRSIVSRSNFRLNDKFLFK